MVWDNAEYLDSESVKNLVDLGSRSRVACVVYKKPTEDPTPRRFIEPYKFLESSENLLVRCFQLRVEGRQQEDAEGWRSFRLDRFVSVSDGGGHFTPRSKVWMHLGEVLPFVYNQDNTPPKPTSKSQDQKYFDLLENILLDGKITDAERRSAAAMAAKTEAPELTKVHAKVFASVVEVVSADGIITPEEEIYLTTVRTFLDALGGKLGPRAKMRYYDVVGWGRDTNRRRNRRYFALSEDDAINKAADDGTIVESVGASDA